MPNKNNRVLLYSNTGLFKSSKHCKFDGKYNTQEIMYNYHPLKTKSPKILYGHFSGLQFFVGQTIRQTDKIHRMAVLCDRLAVFAKTGILNIFLRI